MEAERAEIYAKTKELDEHIATLMQMLDMEDRRFPKQTTEENSVSPEKQIGEFVYDELGRRRMNKQEIRTVVESAGYNVGGRSIHLTLVNLERFGRIRCGEDKRYERSAERARDERSPSFFADMSRSH
jgi:hypothetical protein